MNHCYRKLLGFSKNFKVFQLEIIGVPQGAATEHKQNAILTVFGKIDNELFILLLLKRLSVVLTIV